MLPGVDGRSSTARRFRDICANYEAEKAVGETEGLATAWGNVAKDAAAAQRAIGTPSAAAARGGGGGAAGVGAAGAAARGGGRHRPGFLGGGAMAGAGLLGYGVYFPDVGAAARDLPASSPRGGLNGSEISDSS